MTKPDLYIDGKHLKLAKRIGKGGEGEVYLLGGAEKKAVKVYTGAANPDREAKVKAMVRHELARSSTLVAFPSEIVTTRAGAFAGFSMRLMEGFQEIHQLYGPKSRKIHYPKADFRFLVRAAANAARAIGQVHGSPSVIGDLNKSGLLVSPEATVALIDADSFQFEADGKVYPCLVGKPDFTAPELHGKSLAGVTRVKAHDHFGLAVTIFQLLFMGRHPYAGVQKGSDLSLDQMIAANLFAYSKRRHTGVTPPGILPSLDDFPADIGEGFERAFGLDPARRPAAAEWVNLMQGLESQLSRCANDAMHFYPSAAKTCPWCRMEGATGAVLFLSATVGRIAAAAGGGNFDVEKAWAAIKAVALPDPGIVVPKLSAFSVAPSMEARETKAGNLKHKLFGAAVAIAVIVAWVNIPGAALLWIAALIFAFFRFGKSSVHTSGWQSRYSAVDTRWDEGIAAWRDALGIPGIVRLRADLEAAVNEYRALPAEKTQAVADLKNERHARQLNDYLDRFLIRRASISGIGHAKTITLASFGIESAADIKRNAILAIPGFGPLTADKLMAWRAQHEKRFVYNPAPNQGDVAAQTKLDVDFANLASALARKISGGQAELLQMANTLHQRLGREDGRLSEIAIGRAQLEADLTFLGIAKPYKPAARTSLIYPTTAPPAQLNPNAGTGAVLCPHCGARMVRRTARRGHRRGNQFWGCSRYPSCRGTRP
jgi:DNA-binding helix-hairpin-helix protein with protein kinase domain